MIARLDFNFDSGGRPELVGVGNARRKLRRAIVRAGLKNPKAGFKVEELEAGTAKVILDGVY